MTYLIVAYATGLAILGGYLLATVRSLRDVERQVAHLEAASQRPGPVEPGV